MSGKKYADALKKFDRDRFYSPTEAVQIAKSTATAKFEENLDVVFRLGVDPRKADQMVRGTVALPVGHRQGRPCRRVRQRRSRRVPLVPPAPTWSAPTTCSPRSRPARWTSTSSSPPPT